MVTLQDIAKYKNLLNGKNLSTLKKLATADNINKIMSAGSFIKEVSKADSIGDGIQTQAILALLNRVPDSMPVKKFLPIVSLLLDKNTSKESIKNDFLKPVAEDPVYRQFLLDNIPVITPILKSGQPEKLTAFFLEQLKSAENYCGEDNKLVSLLSELKMFIPFLSKSIMKNEQKASVLDDIHQFIRE